MILRGRWTRAGLDNEAIDAGLHASQALLLRFWTFFLLEDSYLQKIFDCGEKLLQCCDLFPERNPVDDTDEE
jgi:hypothetical protein